MKVNNAFGNTLRRLRDERGLSQEALAEASDLDRSFISMLERGVRQPTLATLWALAGALGIKPHELVKRMVIGILSGALVAGVLVLPSRKLYRFLTDRVGNYQELKPYFPVWRALDTGKRGFLAVMEVEHDATDATVPRLVKGTDGRALV